MINGQEATQSLDDSAAALFVMPLRKSFGARGSLFFVASLCATQDAHGLVRRLTPRCGRAVVAPTTTGTAFHRARRRHVDCELFSVAPLIRRRKIRPNQREQQQSSSPLCTLCSTASLEAEEEESTAAAAASIATNATSSSTQRALGMSVLLTVPLAWGTYTPVVKYLYAIEPPVPGLVFSAAYYTVAAVSLQLLALVALSTTTRTTPATSAGSIAESLKAPDAKVATFAPTPAGLPWRGGAELGCYLFVANALQVVGLQTVPADRAGFLVQLTTVLVPLMEAVGTDKAAVPLKTWAACALAFCGVVVINLDDAMSGLVEATTATMAERSILVSALLSGGSSSGWATGDGLIVMAAAMYSLHVVRLGRYATESTALQLAAAKATVEAFLSTGLVLILLAVYGGGATETSGSAGYAAYISDAGHAIVNFVATLSDNFASGTPLLPTSVWVPAVGAVLWTGWVTCAYTIYAQSFGQSRVAPTDANLIYSVQPLCTALFAYVLLGERLGPAGVVGGALIGTAVYAVTMPAGTQGNKTDTAAESRLPLDNATSSQCEAIFLSNNDAAATKVVER